MGGTEILLVNLLNHLVEKECDVTLLLPNPSDKNILLSRVSPKVSVTYIFEKELTRLKKLLYKNILIFYPRLYARLIGLNASKYDSVLCFKESFYSVFISRLGLPKTQWIHNMISERNFEAHSLKESISFWLNKIQLDRLRKSYNRFDHIVCVSNTCKQSFIDVYDNGEATRKIDVIYNAINREAILGKSKEAIDVSKASNFLNFISVTRFSYEKGTERIMKAAIHLKTENYKFKILLIGNGSLLPKMQKMVEDFDLVDFVSILGYKSNPYPWILNSDWLICSSEKESFGLVLLEGLFLGKGVISTDCGGPAEILDNGKYGILTENSAEGVYLGMKKVLDDPTLLPYFVSKTDECMKRFDYKKWLDEVDHILGV